MASQQGTITVSTCPPDLDEVNRTCWGTKQPVLLRRRVQLKPQPVHFYTCGGDQKTLSSVDGFTLKYDEEHVLMTDMNPTLHFAKVEKDAPVKKDTDQPPVHLVFLVRVMPRHTMVTVGPNTSLFLLLSLDCLRVDQLLLNDNQLAHLMLLYP